jgi:hypothetical protein
MKDGEYFVAERRADWGRGGEVAATAADEGGMLKMPSEPPPIPDITDQLSDPDPGIRRKAAEEVTECINRLREKLLIYDAMHADPLVMAAVGAMTALSRSQPGGGSDGAPECVQGGAHATGLMGGDAGHGGNAVFWFETSDCGWDQVRLKIKEDAFWSAMVRSVKSPDGTVTVEFPHQTQMTVLLDVGGDWEQQGLVGLLRKAWLNLAPLLERGEYPPDVDEFSAGLLPGGVDEGVI